ncbi:hypothetical protein LPJ81_007172 [Coemansia sp. IMI 209127]|nr:hypothetical protein LPJ81_007172 [Coemansia sp. IMI 209127]
MAIAAAMAVVPPTTPIKLLSDSRAAIAMAMQLLDKSDAQKAYEKSNLAYLACTVRPWFQDRTGPTELLWVKGHKGNLGNEEADRVLVDPRQPGDRAPEILAVRGQRAGTGEGGATIPKTERILCQGTTCRSGPGSAMESAPTVQAGTTDSHEIGGNNSGDGGDSTGSDGIADDIAGGDGTGSNGHRNDDGTADGHGNGRAHHSGGSPGQDFRSGAENGPDDGERTGQV